MFSVFEWFVLVLWCDAFVLIVLSAEPGQNQGRGLVDHKPVKAPPASQGGSSVLVLWEFYMWCVVIYRYSCYIYKYSNR